MWQTKIWINKDQTHGSPELGFVLMFVTTTTSVSHERLLQFEFLFGLHDSLHDGFGPGFLAGEMVDGLHHFCIGFPFIL